MTGRHHDLPHWRGGRCRGVPPAIRRFVDEFVDLASDNLYNAHYDRPACLGLLGDVAGRTILDAACGPGLYAEELPPPGGADVIGFDQRPRMAELCQQRITNFASIGLATIGFFWRPGAKNQRVAYDHSA